MKRTSWLAAVSFAGALGAQTLATTADGEQVWLASSWFLREAVTEGRNFIFHRNAGGAWTEVTHGFDFAAVFSPRVTADGSIVVWRRAFPCRFCIVPPPSEVSGVDKPLRIPLVFLSFSPGGRYALSAGVAGQAEFQLEDRQTGVVYRASAGNAPALLLPGDEAAVSDEGQIAGRTSDGRLARWKPGGTLETLGEGEAVIRWGASDDGRRLWMVKAGSGALLWAEGERRAELEARDVWLVRMNPAGDEVFWVNSTQEAWRWEAGSGVKTRLAENVLDVALGARGHVVWILTAGGTLVRRKLEGGTEETVLAGLPLALFTRNIGVPGSALLVNGLTRGMEAAVDGMRLPVIDDDAAQVPWEFRRRGPATLQVRRDGHPFEIRTNAFFETNVEPQLATTKSGVALKAAHEGFRALVTPEDPARQGGLIHTWLFGLGPLDRALATGEPGPREPVARPLTPMACYIQGFGPDRPAVGLEVPFVAYAPGLIGAYQVDLRIPAAWPPGPALIICEAGGRQTIASLPVGH